MNALPSAVICSPAVSLKLAGNRVPLLSYHITKAGLVRNVFLGTKGKCRDVDMAGVDTLFPQTSVKKRGGIFCTFSSSSDNNGNTAGDFMENGEEYVDSSVIEAGMLFDSWKTPLVLIGFTILSERDSLCMWKHCNQFYNNFLLHNYFLVRSTGQVYPSLSCFCMSPCMVT